MHAPMDVNMPAVSGTLLDWKPTGPVRDTGWVTAHWDTACPLPPPITPPVLTLVHREEVADAVPGSMAIVEPHFPERPAGKGLHCSPWRMRRWNRAGSSNGTPALLPPHRAPHPPAVSDGKTRRERSILPISTRV